MKPRIRLHCYGSNRWAAEISLSWTPSYITRAVETASEALRLAWLILREDCDWPI